MQIDRETIIKLAREAGSIDSEDVIETVYTAFAAAEREACAKVCEEQDPAYMKNGERWLRGLGGKPDTRLKDLAPNLEAEWEAEQLLSDVKWTPQSYKYAAAIRARGNT